MKAHIPKMVARVAGSGNTARARVLVAAVLLVIGPAVVQPVWGSETGPVGSFPRGQGSRQPFQDMSLNADYFKAYIYDAKSIIASPLSWRQSNWLRFSLIVGAAVAIAQGEDDLHAWVQARRNDDTHFASDLAEPLGNGRYALPALGVLYCYGRFFRDDRASRTALLSLESIIVSCGITGTIKYLSHKHRPIETSTEDIPWDGPGFSDGHVSFPSGHATCAFAVATVVASEYKDSPVVPPLAYGAAALCAYSRLHDNAHWVSDVIIGSAIGHFTARAIVGFHGGSSAGGFSVAPAISDAGAGLSLSYRF